MPEIKPSLWKTLTRAAILVGMVSMLIALSVYNVLDGVKFHSPAVLGPFGAGAALFIGGIAANLGWIRERITRRKFLVGVNVWAMVFLSLILLLVANAIVAGTPQTDSWFMDWTENRVHTLSQKTRNILGDLDQDVHLTVMMGSGELNKAAFPEKAAGLIRSKVKDLVRLYRGASSNVKVEIIDWYREKVRAERVALGLKTEVEPDSIVVQCAERHKQVPFRDLIEYPSTPFYRPGETDVAGFKGEEKLTEAVLSVSEERQTTVYFTTGHGEMATEGAAEKALNQFVIELKRDNYRVETLNLLVRREIPEDCDLIVIAGPKAPLQDEEVELLRAYLQKDGKLFVLLRPRAARGNAAGLDKLLSEYNVKLHDEQVVIEVYRDLFTGRGVGQLSVIVQDYGDHPITEDLKTMNCLVHYACSLEPAMADDYSRGRPSVSSPYKATPLMRSSAQSWGETNLSAQETRYDPGEDQKGPLTLAMAVEPRPLQRSPYGPQPPKDTEAGPRIVVVGTTAVASDDALKQYEGNRIFVINCVGWLAKRESKLGIPPQRSERRELNTSPAAMKAVFFIAVVGMPLAGAFAGGIAWWIRRR